MSLVAYGSSDESENEEEIHEDSHAKAVNTTSKLELPPSKTEYATNVNGVSTKSNDQQPIFNVIPEPTISVVEDEIDAEEADKAPLPRKLDYGGIEKPPKKKKGPLKIFAPALSDFNDDEEDEGESSKEKARPKTASSMKSSGLVAVLPKPNSSKLSATSKPMIPYALTRKPVETKTTTPPIIRMTKSSTATSTKPQTSVLKSLSNYNSDSEDEDPKEAASGIDFFSLSTPTKIPNEQLEPLSSNELYAIAGIPSSSKSQVAVNKMMQDDNESNKILVSNVINLPKEEILLKNKAEVGPKLPIPEQEYHVDSEGNIAFDDKAIEYLCGKRGVKRKNELNNVDIIEISGEDIKPDEREWLVKALTEETSNRPVSAGTGPGGQSKKKHQITYLAHQAKAMEIELKNQWAQNKASRQATRSKYGF